jgi:uncharacterized alkaline shock family protein YloU
LPTDEIPGRAIVTRRAVTDIVRRAVLGSYGVAGFDAGPLDRLRAMIDGTQPGVRIGLSEARLSIRIRLRVASGLPVAEVARQVDSAVRYAIRHAVGREVDELRVRVGALDAPPGSGPPAPPARPGPGSAELADSGVDVA